METSTDSLYEFGPFQLSPGERLLLREGQPVSLPPKAFDLLVVLVTNAGHLVDKKDLMSAVWPDSFVEEGNLTLNVSLLRKSLQDQSEHISFIETIPKHGYRFSAPVRELSARPQLVVEKHTFSQTVMEEQETIQEDASRAPKLSSAVGTYVSPKALKWVVPAAALVIAAVAIQYVRTRSIPPTSAPRNPVVAVFPLRDNGSDTPVEHLQLGITDALITKLSNVQNLSLKPPSAVRKYFGSSTDAVTAGRELNADMILEGSITKFGGHLRVTTQLVRVADGVSVWAETFDDDITDVFSIEDNISARVAGALAHKLTPQEERLVRKHYTTNSEAYQLYLKGQYFWQLRNKEKGLERGLDYFEKAIQTDPAFALAYVGIANTHAFSDYSTGLWQKGEQAARKAVELDPSLGEPHAALAFINMFQRWDWHAAETEFQQAVALNPNYATGHQWYALFLAARGRIDEAKLEIKKAEELDPYSTAISADVAQIYYFGHEYERAEYQCRQKTIPMDTGAPACYNIIFYSLAKQGRFQEAFPNHFQAVTNSGFPGDAEQAQFAELGMREYLTRQIPKHKHNHLLWHLLSQYSVMLDNKRQALDWLNKAVEEHNFFMVFIKIDPIYDELRSNPRYKELERRVGLADS